MIVACVAISRSCGSAKTKCGTSASLPRPFFLHQKGQIVCPVRRRYSTWIDQMGQIVLGVSEHKSRVTNVIGFVCKRGFGGHRDLSCTLCSLDGRRVARKTDEFPVKVI